MFSSQIRECEDLRVQIWTNLAAVFRRLQEAGIPDTNGDVNHAKFEFTDYEVDNVLTGQQLKYTRVRLKGELYVGGGESDYVSYHLPVDALDNFDAWLESWKSKTLDQVYAENVTYDRQKEEEKASLEAYDREQYERLKAKYEAAG